jgi:DNA-binding FrmR family transcriptional regulator
MTKLNKEQCCAKSRLIKQYPDHSKELHRISRIAGQLGGVKRMIVEREYCPKIITQIQAVRAALKSLEAVVLERHLAICIKETLRSDDLKDTKDKIDELMELFRSS